MCVCCVYPHTHIHTYIYIFYYIDNNNIYEYKVSLNTKDNIIIDNTILSLDYAIPHLVPYCVVQSTSGLNTYSPISPIHRHH